LDYSIDNRVELLQKNVTNNRSLSFVEVGGNDSERFQSAISPLVKKYINVEINRSCNTALRSLGALPPESADVLAAYFVLEHVPHPAEFLESCAHVLKSDGLLIVEVPNLYIYPLNPAGLAWWEHTNHFSPLSLTSVAAVKGLRLRELSYRLCSRPFGFAAVFSKTQQGSDKRLLYESAMGQCEYRLAKACMMDGLILVKTYHSRLEEVREKIRDVCEAGERVVIWGANKVCVDLLEGFQLPGTAAVIDSNPEKYNYLQPVSVYEPNVMKDFILSAKLIVINTHLFAEQITDFIRDDMGRELSKGEILVIKSIG
jgi:SAM-dependent methyltransferase